MYCTNHLIQAAVTVCDILFYCSIHSTLESGIQMTCSHPGLTEQVQMY